MAAILFASLLWLSLMPLGVQLAGDPFQEPFTVLPRLMRIEPLNHLWPYLMGQAWRKVGRVERAEGNFIRALKLNPIDSGVWASLADLYQDEGKKERAYFALRNAAFLEPLDVDAQWGVLVRLMALDLPQARDAIKTLVSRLILLDPTNRRNLFALAQVVAENGKACELLPRDRDVWRTYLLWLVSRGRLDEALTAWNRVEEEGWKDKKLLKRVVDGFISRRGYSQARKIWLEEFPGDPWIHNGGFEHDLAGFGFGWRFNPRISGLKSWGFSYDEAMEGRRSFYMAFDGDENPQVAWPRQLVYIGVPGRYLLSAYMKTEGITGATGFFLSFRGRGVNVRSREFKGYNSWKKVKLEVQVKEPGVYWLALVRPSTQKFNRFLGGRIWLDQVVLEREDEKGLSQGNPGRRGPG